MPGQTKAKYSMLVGNIGTLFALWEISQSQHSWRLVPNSLFFNLITNEKSADHRQHYKSGLRRLDGCRALSRHLSLSRLEEKDPTPSGISCVGNLRQELANAGTQFVSNDFKSNMSIREPKPHEITPAFKSLRKHRLGCLDFNLHLFILS